MKNILKKIGSITTSRRFGWGLLVFALVAGTLYGVNWYSKSTFINAYNAYQVLAAVQQNAAFVPGAESNPVRNHLNNTLGVVLAKETTPKDRLTLSAEGLDLIKQLNAEVDAMHDTGVPVEESIGTLNSTASNFGNIYNRGAMTDLVVKAKAQQETIQNIRGLSYKANFEILQIFNRIIQSNGGLSDQYVTELNNDIPAVEEEFNNRQNSYLDLQKNMYDMQQSFGKLAGSK
jgi:hypothetical protein